MLKYKKCQKCKKDILVEMEKCPWCGEIQKEKSKNLILKILFAMILVSISIIILTGSAGYVLTKIKQQINSTQMAINESIKNREIKENNSTTTLKDYEDLKQIPNNKESLPNIKSNPLINNEKVKTNNSNIRSNLDDGILINIEDIQVVHSIGTLITKQAREDAVFVVVTWNVKNTTEETISLGRELALYSPKGLKYKAGWLDIIFVGVEDSGVKTLPSEGLAPGIKYRTASVFEVSNDQIEKPGWYIKVRNSKFPM